MKFIESDFCLDFVINLYPEYAKIVEVDGGYLAFLTWTDYNIWMGQV